MYCLVWNPSSFTRFFKKLTNMMESVSRKHSRSSTAIRFSVQPLRIKAPTLSRKKISLLSQVSSKKTLIRYRHIENSQRIMWRLQAFVIISLLLSIHGFLVFCFYGSREKTGARENDLTSVSDNSELDTKFRPGATPMSVKDAGTKSSIDEFS